MAIGICTSILRVTCICLVHAGMASSRGARLFSVVCLDWGMIIPGVSLFRTSETEGFSSRSRCGHCGPSKLQPNISTSE